MSQIVSQTGALPANLADELAADGVAKHDILLFGAQEQDPRFVNARLAPNLTAWDMNYERSLRSLATSAQLLGQPDPERLATSGQIQAHQINVDVFDPLFRGMEEGRAAANYLDPNSSVRAFVQAGMRGVGFLIGLRSAGITNVEMFGQELPARGGGNRVFRPLGATPGPCEVLAVELYSNRLRMVRPLLERFTRSYRVALLSMSHDLRAANEHRQECLHTGVVATHWTNFLNPFSLVDATPTLLRLKRDALVELGVFSGASDRELEGILSAARGASVKGATMLGMFRRAIRELRPALIVTARGDGTTLRALAAAAQEKSVTVIDVQHGIHAEIDPAAVAQTRGVHFMVASTHTRDGYKRAGIPETQIHQVGSLVYDRVFTPTGAAVEFEAPFIFYSSSAVELYNWSCVPQHRAIIQELSNFARRNPKFRVLVKPHPQERDGLSEGLVAQLPNASQFRVVRGADNRAHMLAAAAHISAGSTTALEAALLGCPAVTYRPYSGTGFFDDARKLGGIFEVTEPGDICPTLERVAAKRHNPAAIIARYAISDDAQTSSRILESKPVRTALAKVRLRKS